MSPNVNATEGRVSPPQPTPDAHGQAALLLAESTLHALVETRLLTTADAIAVIETASEVKEEIATAEHEPCATMNHSLRLLEAIGDSLRGGS